MSGVHPPAERIAPAQKSNNIQVATFNTRKVNRRALSVAIACKPAGVVRLGPSATVRGKLGHGFALDVDRHDRFSSSQ